ncbi:amino acid permease, partial [Escherichia coli]
AFVGVESAAVSSDLVHNPSRTVPLATLGGTALAGIVYIAASQVIAGMFPNEVVANSGAPFALSASRIVGDWAAPFVSAFTAIA